MARDIISREAIFFQKFAPAPLQPQLLKLSKGAVRSSGELKVAGSRLKASPFSAAELKKFKEIASYHGASAQVAYAEQRLQQLREDKS